MALAQIKWGILNAFAISYFWVVRDWQDENVSGTESYEKGWLLTTNYNFYLWVVMLLGWTTNLIGKLFGIEALSLQFAGVLWIFKYGWPITLILDSLLFFGYNDMFIEDFTPDSDDYFYFMNLVVLQTISYIYGMTLRGPLIKK